MSESLVHRPAGDVVVPESALVEIDALLQASFRPNTRRAYRQAWQQFTEWCRGRGVSPLPATEETIMWYFADVYKGYKLSSLGIKIAAINAAHHLAGLSGFDLKNTRLHTFFQGLRNTIGGVQRQAAPLTVDILQRICARDLPPRDRALLTVGFAGAMRRSEIVGLDWDRVLFVEQGVQLLLLWSKTDKKLEGVTVGICHGKNPNTCPVRALQAWKAACTAAGPVFCAVDRHGNHGRRLSGQAVSDVVRKHVAAIGLDPQAYSGHSLRAGFVTSAAELGINSNEIMSQSRHVCFDTMRKYIRIGSLFTNNASGKIGL